LRGDDPESGYDRLWFALNFYKAAAGLWLRICLVVTLTVVLSTYLSGVVTLLTVFLLYLFGLVIGFILEVGSGKNIGGGPLEAMLRLLTRQHLSAPMEETGVTAATSAGDAFFRFFLRGFLHIIPNVETSDFVDHVAEGFNIGPGQLALSCLLTLAYLLPWVLLGYYMIKWREIASSN
jgi:hypothetical protein